MTTHELKTFPEFFEAILAGGKTFEIRKDDRGFKVGDTLHLREWTGVQYTGREARVTVTYLTGWRQQPGHVVLGIAASDDVKPEPLKDWGPYENAVYALIRMPETSPLLSLARDDDVAAEAIYFDALAKKFKGKAQVIEIELSNNATGAIRTAVANAKGGKR